MTRWFNGLGLGLALVLLGSGCDFVPAMPQNPFRVTPEIVAGSTPAAGPPTPFPTAPSAAFAPYWVKNHRQTEMWSGPPTQPGVISFGKTTGQFCVFQVVERQSGPRLHVLNPYSRDYFWIDADSVGPISETPQQATGPKPPDQNCAELLYDA